MGRWMDETVQRDLHINLTDMRADTAMRRNALTAQNERAVSMAPVTISANSGDRSQDPPMGIPPYGPTFHPIPQIHYVD